MRILVITNYYPPCDRGWGYMQLCEEVVDGLAAKGHQVAVLTSRQRDGAEITRPYPVYRRLSIDPDWQSGKSPAQQFFIGRRRREELDQATFRDISSDFQPNILFLWPADGLSRTLLKLAEQTTATVYYLAGYLPEQPDEYIPYWEGKPVRRSVRWLKRPVAKLALAMLRREGKPVVLEYEHVICVSEYLRRRFVDKNLISKNAIVVHNGVDLSVFSPAHDDREWDFAQKPVRCLLAGRLVPDKGIHTAIESFTLLAEQNRRFHLTILGDGPAPYVRELTAKVLNGDLQDLVTFHRPVMRNKMPEQLEQHDVLLLPSEYAEPIARSMQEAMAMGLLVIGTTTGGSGELLVHEQTGLVMQPGDAQSLACQLKRVIAEAGLAARLARAGQQRVRESFTIEQTVQRVEEHLLCAVGMNRQPSTL